MTILTNHLLRSDLQLIAKWIPSGSRLLDLGCGKGELLYYLNQHKQVDGYGLEIDSTNIQACIKAGVQVIEQDLDQGLSRFSDQSMDTVIMSQALQAVKQPDQLLDDMLRIGKQAIITFPNFAYWRTRLYLCCKGQMPVSKTLPFDWYNTPNIHLCTINDFEQLCQQKAVRILDKKMVSHHYKHRKLISLWPNLLAEIALYKISR